jgi:DNA-directed RNA polymerase beta' subunit
VTRGVPRIEEILSLSSEPKNPSLTVYLKKEDETERERAQTIMYMLEHTKLKEIVKGVELCFDPDDLNTLIDSDKSTLEQYRAFEALIDECATNDLVKEEEEEKEKRDKKTTNQNGLFVWKWTQPLCWRKILPWMMSTSLLKVHMQMTSHVYIPTTMRIN